jgi:DNA polymerase-3 subunit epsilon
VVLCFGKHKDKTLEQIAKEDSGYFKWMYGADFGLHSKKILKKLCLERGIRFE